MASSFNTKQQEENLNSKIVVALERISEAFRVLLWNESKETALSPIQIQLLIFLLFHTKNAGTVSYLAKEFNMSKATISDSIKVLLKKELVQKEKNPKDTRSFIVTLTPNGLSVAKKAASFANVIEKPFDKLSPEKKDIIYNSLLSVINDLNRSGIITVQRMCFSCVHYKLQDNHHYCGLLQKPLATKALRVDCPEHELAV
ncbi:MarR family transcriptional regulator [Mangrovimonas yunxiaonensis]|uniref:MarR family transcriptional regulator n=1 Tax=Mangrovimonas yunxiaonensis TaxID=1197477 RepID=A0A084TK61_9FLAO|nr:MarR family winged helix-turn-helix transcriptional regulator [Mangrovimonas yunxiaonensis]KFB01097.1 MarR family transcriptional regulator [Mangrovimonas yunxiaonensis]MBR9757882.1 winged helix-turn-helix transcriptional regulator [Algicola sp.]GGH38688.1 hypothetical protein GCM10011364_07630 [Mangrovimonas yunxiaonensis]